MECSYLPRSKGFFFQLYYLNAKFYRATRVSFKTISPSVPKIIPKISSMILFIGVIAEG